MTVTLDRAAGVELRRLLPQARFYAGDPARVTSCCCDSRDVLPGDLFVALVGGDHDGHDYASRAIARGAVAVVSERPLPIGDVPNCVVRDTREAYGRICHALMGDPSTRLHVIGVTGTNGKTTTACLIAAVLEAAGLRPGIMGTLGYSDGLEVEPASWTTPPAHVSARQLARIEAAGCSHAVMELSSHALSQRRTAGIVLDTACVTNIRRDHLDFHGSLANYRAAKSRIFRHLKADGAAVINADDPASKALLGEITGPVLTTSLSAAGELNATPVERCVSEQTFLLTAGSDIAPVRTRMIGDHHIANCLQAAAVGLIYGIDLMTVVRGLESVECVPGRLERIECGQPFGVFVDYAHTPDALSGVLGTLREVTRGRLLCVFGCGGDRDREKRPLMGSAVERGADVAVITSDNPRREDPASIMADIHGGFTRSRQVKVLSDRAEAIDWTLSRARPGDTVLIAGKGHEDYQIIGDKRYRFDDREVVRDWLRRHVKVEQHVGVATG